VRDLSQIEARVLAYWAGQEDMVEVFAGGGDPYNHMASQLYGRPVDRKNNPDDKPAGMVGKATVLGCGYGMGWAKFQESLRVGFLGMPGIIFDEEFVAALDVDVDRILSQKANRFTSYTVADMARDIKPKFIDEDTHLVHCAVTKAIIERYRKANSKIVDLWQECNEALTHIKRRMPVEIGSRPLVKTCAEGIVLPNGMILNYHDLRKSAEGWEYMTKERGPMFTKIYGGKMVENITQALARIVIAHQKLELAAEFKIASSTHDEIVMVVPRDKAEYAMARMADVMDRSPGWAPDLPLASEGGFHKSYGLCDK
jgi:DNA polymerase